MRFAKAGWAAAAFVLLASGGCDYWNNLVEEKTLTRADLEVTVVDAWTGEVFKDADCRDSLSGSGLAADGQGHYRIQDGSTGLYEIRCDHIWYYPGAAKIHLAKSGAHDTVKLVRQGGKGNWYPDPLRKVAITRLQRVRFPSDLDWQVTPWDTTGRFRYEWTFRSATALSHGHLVGKEQLDRESYSPRFRARADADRVREGKDTVILTVFSLMNGGPVGDTVGSDTMAFEWVRNHKPFIHFKAPSDSTPYKVGCGGKLVTVHVRLQAGDSDLDGRCTSMRIWTHNAPSLQPIDSTLSCEGFESNLAFELTRPTQSGKPGPNGSEEYENTLYAEIIDDNGEKGRDSVTFLTHTNSPPKDTLSISGGGGGTYFVQEPVTFELNAKHNDGGIKQMDIEWIRASDGSDTIESWRATNFPLDSLGKYALTKLFDTPDKFQAVGRVLDDCDEWGISDSLTFTVVKDKRPVITFTPPETTIRDSTLSVKFNLTVIDPDAQVVGRDSLKLLRIIWDPTDTLTDSTRVPGIHGKEFLHAFPMPLPGVSQTIRIHVEDLHSGSADTTIHIP